MVLPQQSDQLFTCILSITIPSLKPWKIISPPSSCTVGLMRVSSNSLIIMTVSSSSSWISVSAFGFDSVTIGNPLAKKSMMTANISGFRRLHSASSCFDTVMKLLPKNTPRTPSMRNRSFAAIWTGRGNVKIKCRQLQLKHQFYPMDYNRRSVR